MNVWFSKNLGDAMLAWESLEQIKSLFLPEAARAWNPEEMAVFIRHESEGRLHCEARLYFSPATVAVATAVDADPCVQPSADGLDLLAGSEDAWTVLFPERHADR